MKKTISISPPNSLLFVSDINGGDAPTPVRDRTILASSSCVSIACYPEQDGPTRISVGSLGEVALSGEPDFDDFIETPSGVIVVSASDFDTILETRGSRPLTRVTIWLNRAKWPDEIAIGISNNPR